MDDGSAVSAPGQAAAASTPEQDAAARPAAAPPRLSAREARWVLKRCAKRGHVLANIEDDELAARFTATGGIGPLLRCLRCGDFAEPGDVLNQPTGLGDLPLAVRGGHGRKLALLRLLSIERGIRGMVLLLAAVGVARLSTSHVQVADWLGQVVKTAQPLSRLFGWDLQHSPTVTKALHLLGNSDSTFRTIAWLLGAYGVLELVEGIGLWGGWLWAEYLAAVATAVFIPIEVYELTEHLTVTKVVALLINVAAVFYLVYKGRLFGLRGGHRAYLAEVRDGTLAAAELRALGRPTTVLTSHELV